MKRLLRLCALILAAALLVSLAACGSAESKQEAGKPEKE